MTIGEKRVRVEFNPSQNDLVSQVKQKTAELINLIESLKERPAKEGHNVGEFMRLVSLAQTSYEEAAMWSVKAVTM